MPPSDAPSLPGPSPSGDQGHPDRETARANVEVEIEYVALPPGQTVGRYEIMSLLAYGTLGPSYRACERRLGHDVVIKEFLPPALAMRSDGIYVTARSPELAAEFARTREGFVEEARRLTTLRHAPFLARVVDVLEANGTAYVVLDLVAGPSLEDRLHAGNGLTPGVVDRLLRALLEGLAQLHEAGLLHGDITPANIVLDMSGRPTLINITGKRRATSFAVPPPFALSTDAYAAPEHFDAERQGPWTDIYGLAATFHHAIVGTPPPAAAQRLRADSYRRLAALAPSGFAPALLAGIDKGLELDAGSRPRSVAEWLTMLWPAPASRALAAAVPTGLREIDAEALRTPRSSRLGFSIMAGTALFTLAAMAGLAYCVFNGRPTDRHATASSVAVAAPSDAIDSTRRAWKHADMQSHQAALDEARRDREREQAALDAVEKEMRALTAAHERERAKEAEEAAAAAARRRQEEEQAILKKLEAEAQARRQAEIEAEANRPAEPAAEAEPQTEMLDLEAAKAEERTLQLSVLDRQHVQVAFNALGFDVGDIDGALGPLMRRTIAQWQRARKEPPTGYLTSADNQTLLKFAARPIAQFDALQNPWRAEADEMALHLSSLDREHVQVALTALGFDAGDVDSMFGVRTRQMIAAWQTSLGDAPTGFLTAEQVQRLMNDGAGAIARYDDTLEPTHAEAREAGLNLSPLDRQHLQVALTAQGFDPYGADSLFGPRTRQMIAAWQKSRGEPVTGFLTADEVRRLSSESAAAIARFDNTRSQTAAAPQVPAGAPMVDSAASRAPPEP